MSNKNTDITENLHLLGQGKMPLLENGPEMAILECFPNRFPQRLYIIQLIFPEFTSLCPVTGQPDFGTIVVEYLPDKLCVESKSFKLYMFAYRNHHAFMETLTNQILDDLYSLLDPYWCRVKGVFAPRGGTRINVFAEQFKSIDSPLDEKVKLVVGEWRKEHAS